jgi:glycosyltransferase involved in cell wall biosynthesis
MSPDEIGVVVIGRNEGQRLIDCLNSIVGHKGRVVYVDSGSTDGSTTVAEKLGAFVVRLDMAQPFTAARARNEGFAALMALEPNMRFVQFIDGDCEIDSKWMDAASSFISKRDDVAIVCGRRRERDLERSLYNRLCDIEWNTPVGEALACGGDSLMRVDAFREAVGFRPQLVAGEEPELCARIRQKGWKVWRLDAEMTRHDAAMTRFGQWWLRGVRSGYGYAELSSLGLPSSIYEKEKARALIWGGLLPLLILVGAAANSYFLWAAIIYLLQIGRIALRKGSAGTNSRIYALFMTLAKFAEFEGILKFYWRRWRGRAAVLFEYK